MGLRTIKNRIENLKSLIADRKEEALFISNLTNVRFLSGFTGSNAAMIVFAHPQLPSVFLTDSRYEEQASLELQRSDLDDIRFLISEPKGYRILELVSSETRRNDIRRLAVETSHLSVADYNELTTYLGQEVEVVDGDQSVQLLRRTKDITEIQEIEKACQIADGALSYTKTLLTTGVTEREFAIELEYQMLKFGAEDRSFPSIVASGERSSLPHGHPTDRRIREGDVVVVDFGAVHSGYHSDCTRTYFLGEPSAEVRETYELVLEAQQRAVATLCPGVTGRKLDGAARSVFKEKGVDQYFAHGLGHGVGLDIHERPFISTDTEVEITEGFVVTIEPGLYLSGRFGVRIEDTILVSKDGSNQLTRADKQWILR